MFGLVRKSTLDRCEQDYQLAKRMLEDKVKRLLEQRDELRKAFDGISERDSEIEKLQLMVVTAARELVDAKTEADKANGMVEDLKTALARYSLPLQLRIDEAADQLILVQAHGEIKVALASLKVVDKLYTVQGFHALAKITLGRIAAGMPKNIVAVEDSE